MTEAFTDPARPPCARPLGLLAVFFLLWCLRMALFGVVEAHTTGYVEKRALSEAWRIAIWIGVPLLWLALIERRPPGDALHPPATRASRWWPAALLFASLAILMGERAFKGAWIGIPPSTPADVLVAGTLSVMVVAVAEEFLFRGVVLSGLIRTGWSFLPAAVLSTAAFALSHWPGWLYGGPMPLTTLLLLSLRVFVFGLLMAGLVRLESGLRSAVLVHFLNNFVSGAAFGG